MRQNWVEFITDKETEKCETVCLRPEYILAIQDRANKGTRLTYDCNSETGSVDVTEPYEQVKQKIMNAEKSEYSEVVERFTREEYEVMHELITKGCELCEERGMEIGPLNRSILNKLNKILNGDK